METGGFEVRAMETGAVGPYGAPVDRPAALAMQRLWVTGQILPVGARILVQHTFRNGEEKPLEIVYAFMLPRDAALRRFEVRGDGFQAHSVLRKIEEAVQQYEEGIEAGHLSTLARSYRDGVVNLSLGNLKRGDDVTVTLEILAGVELHDDGLRFRFPFTLAPGYHPRAHMMDVDGVGEIELPQSEFGDVILPPYRRSADGLHEVGFDLALRIPGQIAEVASASHPIRAREDHGGRRITLATETDVPNRDLVLDIRVSEPQTLILAGEKHFAVAIPSTNFGTVPEGPRKVALVIDRSGSMGGQPMLQARRAVDACLGALSQDDEFAIIAFDDQVESFQNRLAKATSKERENARSFMKSVDARGGTELARGFSAAAKLVAGGGDILIVTDGQVMGTEEIIAQARALNLRLHCLGIGSASQDRFLAQLAASTEGVSRFVTPQERVDVAAVDLFASIGRPVASDVKLEGATLGVAPSTAVFAGTPWVAFAESSPGKVLKLTWSGGAMEITLPRAVDEASETLRLLDGARRIADLESRVLPGMEKEFDRVLGELSTTFGLASRAMALVAVVKRTGDIGGDMPSTMVVPLGMPHGTQFDSYFGSPALRMMAAPAGAPPPAPGMSVTGRFMVNELSEGYAASPAQAPGKGGALSRFTNIFTRKRSAAPVPPVPHSFEDAEYAEILVDETDQLLDIASNLSPDGGMPGSTASDRALKTISAILLFLSEGHTPTSGAFRAHVERMVRFLETVKGLQADERRTVDAVTAFAREGRKPALGQVTSWDSVKEALKQPGS